MTEFKSQICTTVEQSKRLLGLGLKKETADMTWKFSYLMKGVPRYDCLAESTWDEETIARYVQHCGLMNLTEHWKHPDGTQMSSEEVYAEITKKDIPAWGLHRLIEILDTNPCVFYTNCGYDNIIDRIEDYIKEGIIDTRYLEEWCLNEEE